jgi:hypothetical protein
MGLPFLLIRGARPTSTPVFQIIASIVLLTGFVLPWINADALFNDFSMKGYEIPSKLKAIYNLQNDADNATYGGTMLSLLYLLYLIPIASLSVVILGLYRRNKEIIFPISIIGTISTLLGIAIIVIKKQDGDEFISHLDIGFYLTVITGFCLWVSLFMTSNSNHVNTENEVKNREIEIPPPTTINDDLLSQLLKLQTLKEKGVIGEDVYERERKKLLDKLNNE